MQLDDLIEEQSIASIARKTNIAEKVVEKLFNREFEAMKMPQAMGAISIIEREYRMKLDDLRQECRLYFDDLTPNENGLANIGSVKKKKTIFPKLFIVLLLILLIYGAWYFFTGYYNQKVKPMDPPENKTSFIDTILGKDDTAIKKISEQSIVQETPEEIKIPEKIEVQDSIVEEIVVEQKESVVVDIPEDNSDIAESMMAETSVVEHNKSSQQVVVEESVPEIDVVVEKTPIVVVQKSVVLLPQQEMWFRLTNEKTKTKRQFRRKFRYEIDLKENNWLFATENALFAFMNNDFFEEFGGAGKLFFRLDQQGVHQLSENEYRTACK